MNSDRQMRCVVLCEKCQGAFPLWSIFRLWIDGISIVLFVMCRQFEIHRDERSE